jgi:hypothetical protein
VMKTLHASSMVTRDFVGVGAGSGATGCGCDLPVHEQAFSYASAMR